MSLSSGPLSRFRVLDLTRARAGPTAARMLADWGMQTIKIEQPAELSEVPLGGPREGFDFQNLHRNKRSMTLNLKEEAGREILFKLAKETDVFIENYRPDVKHRLGIDYETINKTINLFNDRKVSAGGSVANTVSMVASLGDSCAFIGRRKNDIQGKRRVVKTN